MVRDDVWMKTAKTQLAPRAIGAVSNVAIWGNHSSTRLQIFNADRRQAATDVITDHQWLETD
jgi:hypothetical protein